MQTESAKVSKRSENLLPGVRLPLVPCTKKDEQTKKTIMIVLSTQQYDAVIK